MKTLFVNQRVIVLIFAVTLLIYGVQGIGYSQNFGDFARGENTPTVASGETNTSLRVSFLDRLYEADKRGYQVQLRRKNPQGDWILKCDTIKGWLVTRPNFSEEFFIIFTDLEPGTTYQARWRETNQSFCSDNPPAPGEWSPIGEGTTLLETPPRVEFSDFTLAIAVRRTLGLDITDGVDILKIPEAQLTQLTNLSSGRKSLEELRMDKVSPENLDLPDIANLTGLEHATQLKTLSLRYENISDISPLAELTQLSELNLPGNQIRDISPLTHLTQLSELNLEENHISDVTPLAQLTQLSELNLPGNQIRDISPFTHLTQLSELNLEENHISDVTPLAQLTQLSGFLLGGNQIRDLTPFAQLTHLTWLSLGGNNISDVTPLTQLASLERLSLGGNQIRDLPSLVQLTQLTWLSLEGNHISDVTPLTQLTQLSGLNLAGNQIRDLTPLAQLVSLETLRLSENQIRDVTPLKQLADASLTELDLSYNQISDVSPLAALVYLEELLLSGNPIENTYPLSALLAENPGLYIDIEVIRDERPTLNASASPPLTGRTLHGSVVTLTLSSGDFIAGIRDDKLTISGITGIGFDRTNHAGYRKITVELTFKGNIEKDATLTFTLKADAIEGYNGPPLTAEIPVSVSVDSDSRIAFESSFTPEGYTRVTLSNEGIVVGTPTTYTTDSDHGTVAYMLLGKLKGCGFATAEQVRRSTVYIKTQSLGRLNNFASETVCGKTSFSWSSSWNGVRITHLRFFDESSSSNINEAVYNPSTGQYELITEPDKLAEDVNGDGIVNIQDLVLVAGALGKTGQNAADVNGDGIVNIQDLVLVAGALGTSAAAPPLLSQSLAPLTAADINNWLSQAQQLNLTDATSLRGILFLQQLLATLIPKETTLLANYPNPFNPETWIPYHLAKDANVTLHIYAVNGTLVRTLTLGHQAAGIYQNRSRAAYWDGKNALGESVASGVYFYTLTAGDFSATRKMLILK